MEPLNLEIGAQPFENSTKASSATDYGKQAAAQLFGFYKHLEPQAAWDRSLIAGIVTILSSYPEDIAWIVVDPVRGLPSRSKWLPNIAEVRAECESYYRPIREKIEWEKRAQAQFEEREPERITQSGAHRYTYQEFLAGAAEGKWPAVPKGFFER